MTSQGRRRSEGIVTDDQPNDVGFSLVTDERIESQQQLLLSRDYTPMTNNNEDE
jgi:hypothetical protein